MEYPKSNIKSISILKNTVLDISLLYKFIFIIYLIALSNNMFAQQGNIDNLESKIVEARKNNDSKTEYKYLVEIANIYAENNKQKAIKYFEKSLSIAKKINSSHRIKQSQFSLGLLYSLNKNYDKAELAFFEVYKIAKKFKNNISLANALINYGIALKKNKKYNLSAEKLKEALNIVSFKEYDDMLIEKCYVELMNLFKESGDKKQYMKYHDLYETKRMTKKTDEFDEKINIAKHDIEEKDKELSEIADTLSNVKKLTEKQRMQIKITKIENAKNKLEIKNQKQVLKHERQIIKILVLGIIIVFIFGLIAFVQFLAKRRTNKILVLKNVEISQQKEEIQTQSEELLFANNELKKLSIAISKTKNAIFIFSKTGKIEWVNSGFTRLYGYTYTDLVKENKEFVHDFSNKDDISSIINKCITHKQATAYQNEAIKKDKSKVWLQTTITPILDDFDNISKFIIVESDISKLKKAEIEILEQNSIIEAKNKILKLKNHEIIEQNRLVENQNIEIIEQRDLLKISNDGLKSSIKYAKTIQNAILPIDSHVKKYLEYFIIYDAKDIVSGDFYWMSVIKNSKDEVDRIFLAVIDCTGHGVPGAFMSMIGNRLLSEIVNEGKIYSPKEILTQLSINVIDAFNQNHTSNNDSMDVCICSIEKINKTDTKLIFSGAKRPLFYNIKGEKEIKILKGDRKTVGGIKQRTTVFFTNQEIILNQGDRVFLTSDGIIDQNNPERKRFGTKRFVNSILVSKDKSLENQKTEILKILKNYQKDTDQRDDITVLACSI